MGIPLVDLKAQYTAHKDELDAAIAAVLSETAFIQGKYAKAFEEAFAAWVGATHCIGVGNGTDAITIAARSLDLHPADEVIVPANSFVASSEAITSAGAQVVFCDVDPKTSNLDPAAVRAAITPRTKALLPVHLYGQPCDMAALMPLAQKHGLKVIEDCAQAHGATFEGKRIGTFGDLACFSFYPGKNLGAYGDAGAVLTSNDTLGKWCRMFANHGRSGKYDHAFEGVNSRMDGIQGAVLKVKLQYLHTWNQKRRDAAAAYNTLLQGSPVQIPYTDPRAVPVFHLYVVRTGNRDECLAHLNAQGIGAGIHYPVCLPNLQAYRHLGHRPEDFPVATRQSSEILSLPIYPEITQAQIEQVAAELLKVARPVKDAA